MSLNPFDSQQLACVGYASIKATVAPAPPGFVVQNQGFVLSRTGVGVYLATFGADLGIVDGQSYTHVTPKDPDPPAAPLPPVTVKVQDTSNLVKTILVYNAAGAPVDSDLEVSIYKSLINPAGP